jgi:hypothetical protein
MNNLKDALKYLKHYGFSVIPTGKDKKPLIKWEEYQKRKPTEAEIGEWFKNSPEANVGIVTGDISGICVVDVDSKEAAEEIIKYLPDTIECPTVQTPRGGHHLYFRSAGLPSKNGVLQHIDFKANGGYVLAPPSQNGHGKAYEWTISPSTCVPPELPTSFLKILKNIYKSNTLCVNNGAYKELTSNITISLHKGMRNESLNKILFHLYRGGMSLANGTYIADFIGEKALMDPKEIDATNKSAWKGANNKSLAEEVREWVSLQSAWFLLTDYRGFLGKDYNVLTRDERKNLYVIMNRLVDQGLIEKNPSKTGCYRKRDQNLDPIDLEAVEGREWEIEFPLGIHELVHIYAKQIIVVYSGPDGGKSAYLFDLMQRNMVKLSKRINYFSSEMEGPELSSRLMNTGISIKEWKRHINFWSRSRNFADVIKPEDINIIDFMAVHEDFSLIAKYIDEIWDRLTFGIAIVVLQSKYNSDLPRGAEFALEKARLAFTLLQREKHHLCKITKAKNWKNHMMNPNYKVRKFSIYKGCDINGKGDWMTMDEYETLEGNGNFI